jgi:hypothetical protein
MTRIEIITAAKKYFGKNRTHIKNLVLSYEFKGKNYRRLKKEIGSLIPNPNKICFGLFDDVITWINDNQPQEINWHWIGDLSWTIDILLNDNVDKGFDWDKNLALKCNGTARLLTVFVSEVLPCYTYDIHYMTYNKSDNYYEFGPIDELTEKEKYIISTINSHFKTKGLVYLNSKFCNQKFKELYSDTNSNGNASLFDVLFKDIYSYQTDIQRICDKEIIEKSGTTFRWREYYNKNKTLKERHESRYFGSGDYLKTVLDNKNQIIKLEVVRKQIENKPYQNFELDVIDTFKKRKTKKDK